MDMWEKWKADTRKEMTARRKALSFEEREEKSTAVAGRVLQILNALEPKAVYAYYSVRGEVSTAEILNYLWKNNIPTALPRVEGREMSFFYVKSADELIKGAFGIPEPAGDCRRAKEPAAAVLVPGVAFSRDGKRLGYGGGYYDRFLAAEPAHLRIGLAYEFQLLHDFYTGEHDMPMDLIAAPGLVYDCKFKERSFYAF